MTIRRSIKRCAPRKIFEHIHDRSKRAVSVCNMERCYFSFHTSTFILLLFPLRRLNTTGIRHDPFVMLFVLKIVFIKTCPNEFDDNFLTWQDALLIKFAYLQYLPYLISLANAYHRMRDRQWNSAEMPKSAHQHFS